MLAGRKAETVFENAGEVVELAKAAEECGAAYAAVIVLPLAMRKCFGRRRRSVGWGKILYICNVAVHMPKLLPLWRSVFALSASRIIWKINRLTFALGLDFSFDAPDPDLNSAQSPA